MRASCLVVAALLVASGHVAAHAAAEPFGELLSSYHSVRMALVQDNLAEAAQHARVIEKRALELGRSAALADEGVTEEQSAEWLELVEEIATAAGELSSADELGSARDAFFALSKPMGRYRKLIGDDSTIVAFCPMAKKAWLQADGEFENPYLGQEMPTCGQRIPD